MYVLCFRPVILVGEKPLDDEILYIIPILYTTERFERNLIYVTLFTPYYCCSTLNWKRRFLS